MKDTKQQTESTSKPFKIRSDAPAFVPSGLDGSHDTAQAIMPVFSLPASGGGTTLRDLAPISCTSQPNHDKNYKPSETKDHSRNPCEERDASLHSIHPQEASPTEVLGSTEPVENSPGRGSKASKEEKSENWGPLIPVSVSGLDSSQEKSSKLEKSESTYDFFAPLKENDEPPHRNVARKSHWLTSGSDISTEMDVTADMLHEKNLVLIKDFAHRVEAFRRGDNNAIRTTEVVEEERSLPAVSIRLEMVDKLVGFCV